MDRRVIVVLVLGSFAACGGGGGGTPPVPVAQPSPIVTSSPSGPSTSAIVTPPPHGAFLGAFVNDGSGASFAQQTDAFEQGLSSVSHVEKSLATHLHFYSGNPANAKFVADVGTDPDIADDYAHGRIPVVTWTCADKLSAIASGSDDATLIVPVAQAMKSLPGPVMVRWFHEFELNLTDGLNSTGTGTPNGQYQWCFDAYNPNETRAQNIPAEAAEFVAAWQHIHAVFVQQGVHNVTWVWNPGGSPSTVNNDSLLSFFPGPSYVDWAAGDFYDKPAGACNGIGLRSLLTPFYNLLTAAYPSLPIMMTETGEDQSHTGCTTGANWTQQQYFQDMLADLPALFPQIKAVQYFDSQGNAPFDWTLTPGSAGYDAFAQLESSDYFTLGTGQP